MKFSHAGSFVGSNHFLNEEALVKDLCDITEKSGNSKNHSTLFSGVKTSTVILVSFAGEENEINSPEVVSCLLLLGQYS